MFGLNVNTITVKVFFYGNGADAWMRGYSAGRKTTTTT